MDKVIGYLIDRLKEPSTYEGLTVLLTLVGIAITPEQTAALTTLGGSIYGVIKVLKKEAR